MGRLDCQHTLNVLLLSVCMSVCLSVYIDHIRALPYGTPQKQAAPGGRGLPFKAGVYA